MCWVSSRARFSFPYQEQADIAGYAVGELQNPSDKMKSARLQVGLPPYIDFGGLASESGRPIRIWHIDQPTTVRAELAGEAQQQELLFPMLSCKACLPKQSVPAFIRDMFAQELGNLVLPTFSGRVVCFGPLPLPPVFKLGRRTLKVCHC
jgi:hypothetical protein